MESIPCLYLPVPQPAVDTTTYQLRSRIGMVSSSPITNLVDIESVPEASGKEESSAVTSVP